MKKQIFSLLSAAVLLLTLTIPVLASEADGSLLSHVTDDADLLSDSQEQELEQRAAEISDAYLCDIYIVTVEDYTVWESSVYESAKYIYGTYELGRGSERDGFMLLLSMSERDYALIAHGALGNASLTDYGRDCMIDEFLDDFADDDWYGGFQDYLEESEFYLRAAAEGEPFDLDTDHSHGLSYGESLIAGFIFAAIVAAVVCFVFKKQMNTAVRRTAAEEYVTENGVIFRSRIDQYTHTTVSRRKIEKESSDSDGGTTVDSDGYSGSSGKF